MPVPDFVAVLCTLHLSTGKGVPVISDRRLLLRLLRRATIRTVQAVPTWEPDFSHKRFRHLHHATTTRVCRSVPMAGSRRQDPGDTADEAEQDTLATPFEPGRTALPRTRESGLVRQADR